MPAARSCARDDASTLQRMETMRRARASSLADLLARVGDAVRIHRLPHPSHAVEIRLAVHLCEKLPLLQPDAVLARNRSAQADAHAQDLGCQHLRPVMRSRLTAVVQ